MSEQRVRCPRCSVVLRVKAGTLKGKMKCPQCQHVFGIRSPQRTQSAPIADPLQSSSFDQPTPISSLSWTKKRKRKSKRNLVLPMVFVGAGIAGLVVVIGLGFLLIPRASQTAGVKEDSGAIPGATSKSRPGTAAQPRRAKESLDDLLVEATKLFEEIETKGKDIPDDDQSEASAQTMLAYVDKLNSLLKRSCQVAPISTDLSKGQQLISQMTQTTTKPVMRGRLYFWHLDTTDTRGRPVTEAINQLTRVRSAIFNQLKFGLIDLPSPLALKEPDSEWTDEDRRQLAIMRIQGGLARDFAFELAPVDIQSPTENDLWLMHRVIDKYAAEGVRIGKLKGDSGILASVPRNSIYEHQKRAASIALIRLRITLFGNRLQAKTEERIDSQLAWLLDEFKRVDEAIDGLSFFSGDRSKFPTDTSSERYDRFVLAEKAAAKQAEIAEQKAKAEAAQRAEQARLADIEKQRQREEANRLAEIERKKSVEATQAFKDGLRNSPFGPGRRGSGLGRSNPGRSNPGQTNPGRGNPGASAPGRRGSFRGGNLGGRSVGPRRGPPSTDPNRDTSNDVSIRITETKKLDTQAILDTVPVWIKKYGISVHNRNGQLGVTVRDFDRPLTELQSAFPKLEFVKINQEERTIVARETDSGSEK